MKNRLGSEKTSGIETSLEGYWKYLKGEVKSKQREEVIDSERCFCRIGRPLLT